MAVWPGGGVRAGMRRSEGGGSLRVRPVVRCRARARARCAPLQVKNRAPAPIQITAEQILLEAKSRMTEDGEKPTKQVCARARAGRGGIARVGRCCRRGRGVGIVHVWDRRCPCRRH